MDESTMNAAERLAMAVTGSPSTQSATESAAQNASTSQSANQNVTPDVLVHKKDCTLNIRIATPLKVHLVAHAKTQGMSMADAVALAIFNHVGAES